MAISNSRWFGWNFAPKKERTVNIRSLSQRAYNVPSGFVAPPSASIYDIQKKAHYVTQAPQLDPFNCDPRYGRTRQKFSQNTMTITQMFGNG